MSVESRRRAAAKRANDQARRAAAAQQPANANYWHRPEKPLAFGRDDFRTTLIRAQGGTTLNMDGITEGITWDDVDPTTSGSVQLRKPVGVKVAGVQGASGSRANEILNPAGSIDAAEGDLIRLEVADMAKGAYAEVWRMRLTEPELQAREGTLTLNTQDESKVLTDSKDDFRYRKDHAHPHGWTPRQIIIDVCRRYHIPTGRLPSGGARIKQLYMTNAAPMDVINRVLKHNRGVTGNKDFVTFEHGRLTVVPRRRNADLLTMGPTLIDAVIKRKRPPDFCTVLVARGTLLARSTPGRRAGRRTAGPHGPVGSTTPGDLPPTNPTPPPQASSRTTSGGTRRSRAAGAHKVWVEVRSEAMIRRYGVIKKDVNFGTVANRAELVSKAKRGLAKLGQMVPEVVLTHPGITSVKRGDAVRVTLPDEGIDEIVYVTEARHTVSAGNYQMELTVKFDDPMADFMLEIARQRRESAARRRRRRAPARRRTRQRGPVGSTTPGDLPPENPTPPKTTAQHR